MTKYDVIIIGAGPAGLSVGSELSRKFKVLVIDKSTAGNPAKRKDWTTKKGYLEGNELTDFISSKYKKCSIKSVLGSQFFVYADFVTVKGKALVDKWAKDITSNSSHILEYCGFEGVVKNDESGIEIKTSRGNYSGRLLIDCSGVDTTLPVENGLYEKVYYFPVYGGEYRVRLNSSEPNLFAANTRKSPMYYFDVFPVTKNTCVFYTFQYLDNYKDPKRLKKMHSRHLNSSYLKEKIANKKKIKHISGVIPMGHMEINAMDRIAFFGDSALMAGALGGTGFTNILLHHKAFSNQISRCLQNDTLDQDALRYLYSDQEKINRKIQLVLGSLMPKLNSRDYDLLVETLSNLPNGIIINLLSSNLTPRQCEEFFWMIYKKVGLKGIWEIVEGEGFPKTLDRFAKIIEEMAIVELKKYNK